MRRAGGGSIINISSVAAFLATSYASAYGASKAAIWQLTRSVAQHCAENRLRIRCNSVHPGNVWTALWQQHALASASARNVTSETIRRVATAGIPLGDFTTAEDVAATVSFLASDEARHLTGTQLIVDGGILGCGSVTPDATSGNEGHGGAEQ
jgi:NAD(P)-dependent dehydrogenase (short-subunit alcohol dehydrogenase family)